LIKIENNSKEMIHIKSAF